MSGIDASCARTARGFSLIEVLVAMAIFARSALQTTALFLFILLSYQLGWIHPTGLPLKS